MTKALIVVDVQVDFVEGGALGVEGGKEVAYKIVEHARKHISDYEAIVFTQDFHNPPPDTNGGHFADEPDYVDTWPVHCVAGRYGSELFVPIHYLYEDLDGHGYVVERFVKGQGKPDYSGFQGVSPDDVKLMHWLVGNDIDELDVVGIAGDHCVKATALDARDYGFKVNVLPDMVASVGGQEATDALMRLMEDA